MAGDGLVGLNCPRGGRKKSRSESIPESIPDVDLISMLVRLTKYSRVRALCPMGLEDK